MGQTPSKPEPGTKLQVIVAGLPRTGTASISEALRILLQKPVYHGGTQVTMSEENEIKSWIQVLKRTPIKSPNDKEIVMNGLQARFDGYAATADVPGQIFVEELLQLFPQAKVIVTVRDKERWVESMNAVSAQAHKNLLSLILWPVPTMRLFPRFLDAVEYGRWGELYFHDGTTRYEWARIWDNHMKYVKRVVPQDRLLFFDVKDGWSPLCEFLGLPEPKDIEFPKINDGKSMEAFAAKQVQRGLKLWAAILAGGTLALAIVVMVWRKR